MTKVLSIIVSFLLLGSCTSTNKIEHVPSANSSFRIKSLIMHFTAVDYANSKRLLVEEGGLSAHYLIPQSNDSSYPYDTLKVLQLVDENERAWHAGVSHWQGRNGLNDSSIGIEIVNVPQCNELVDSENEEDHAEETTHVLSDITAKPFCIYPDFDPQQIQLLIELSQDILKRNPDISPTSVVGHSDIAPSRKHDPGPRFPWYQLYQHGIGAWYDNDTIAKYWRLFKQSPLPIALLQQALSDYGYDLKASGELNQVTIDTIEAFQMHFLPWQVTGKNNARTAAAIMALLEKYFPNKAEKILAAYELENIENMRAPLFSPQSGQIDQPFYSSSTLDSANNRARFYAYAGQGQLNILSNKDTKADIFINGQQLNLADVFTQNVHYQYSLSKRTQDGLNTLFVDNISPADSELIISIPYPTLATALPGAQHASFNKAFLEVEKLITQELKRGLPGAAVLIAHKGNILKKKAWGFAKKFDAKGQKLELPLALSTNTLFDVATHTKTLSTSLAIMHLAHKGLIDINEPVVNYLGEFRGNGRELITIKDLLQNDTLYPVDIDFFNNDQDKNKGLFSQNKTHTQYLISQRLSPSLLNKHKPQHYGHTIDSNNINFMLLGMVIERVTQLPLDEYVEQAIFKRLSLTNSLYKPLEKQIAAEQIAATAVTGNTRGNKIQFVNARSDVIHGEVHNETAFYSMQEVSGHAGLFTTLGDAAVLAQILLNKGGYGDLKLFDERSEFTLGWKKANEQNRWLFGPYASSQAFGHGDANGTFIVIDPEHDLIIVLLSNQYHRPQMDADELWQMTADITQRSQFTDIVSMIYETIMH